MTALVTGASSGIGLELARECAAHGHDVVLVARGERALGEVAAALERDYRIRALAVPGDLAERSGVEAVVSRIVALDLSIELLVNNAGYGVYGPFVQTPLDTELGIIAVNVAALTHLTKRFLPPMVARRSGRILKRRVDGGVSAGAIHGRLFRIEGVRLVVQRGAGD